MKRSDRPATAAPPGAGATSSCVGFGAILAAGHVPHGRGVPGTTMRVLGHYAVVFLAGGSGRYRLRDREPVPCRPGDLLIVFPDIPHTYGPGGDESWHEYYLIFDGAVFDLWRMHGILSPDRPVLRPPRGAGTLREIRELVRGASRPGLLPADSLPLVCRLQELLARAARSTSSTPPVLPEWARRGVTALGAVPPASPVAAARAAGLSYESFRKKFRDLFGESPRAWSNRRTIERARKLIYEERLGNKEIADRLGFCDEFHFSKRFRRVTGQTPSEARRALAGKSGATAAEGKSISAHAGRGRGA
jgi:AraC-like DNA-binding protein